MGPRKLAEMQFLQPYVAFVDTAINGHEALAKLTESNFDLLITDISMPDMSGEELHHIVKTHYPHLPVVALTGNAAEADKQQYLKSGFAGVSVKPIQKDTLLAIIDRIKGNNGKIQAS